MQKQHRDAFIDECRQKAWNVSCNADWIGKQLDDLLAQYEKCKREDAELEEQTLDSAIDYHTKDNREKRKALQERRNVIAKQQIFIQQSAEEAQQAMQQLYASVEHNLALAKHPETWDWKEVDCTQNVR